MLSDAVLAETAEALRSDRLDPEEYLETIRDRVKRVEPDVRAFVDGPEWARLAAEIEGLAERYPDPAARPPLFGVPVGVKDIFHVDGFPTRAGSDVPPDVLAGPEAATVRALREAGAMVLSKTVTTEFAYFEPGPTRNPHDLDHTPGGSSSGSAAAVAAGMCPLALGSQTVGSVNRPAAFCGVVGFKPSFARISIDGVVPLSPSLDHVGLFTQDVAGAELAAAVLFDEWRSLPTPSHRPTLGVPTGPYLEQASPEGLEAFEAHLETLETAGYDVVRLPAFENIDDINERHYDLMAAEVSLAHHEVFESHGDRLADRTADLIREGREVSARKIAVGRTGRKALREELASLRNEHGVDLWICPAAPGPAPEGIDSTGDPAMNLPWTHSGVPSLTIPAGDVEGLPVAIQCAGTFNGDERLFAWARGLEEALSVN